MYDTIIVGAGSAGCVLANRLSADPARKVLLLEAGGAAPRNAEIPANWPLMLNTEVDWGFHTEPQAGCRMRRMYWPRGRMLGGSGALNAMIYIRGVPSDYARWEAAGCPGWGWREVLPAFMKSERNLRWHDSPLHGTEGELVISDVSHIDPVERLWLDAAHAAGLPLNADFNGDSQDGVGLFQATIKDGERFGTGKAFLQPALARPNLTVRTGATLLRVRLCGTRATGVMFLENGVPQTAEASSEVVLSAGAIGSPQLLMHSGIGPADELSALGIRPLLDLPGVGRNLQDHINCPVSFTTRQRFGIAQASDAEAAAHLQQWEATRCGPLSSNWSACGGFARTDDGAEAPDLQLYCIVTAHRDHARYQSTQPGITLFSVVQRPQSRGVLRLRSADPLERPAIDPRYFSDPEGVDLQLVVDGIRLQRRIAALQPLREVIAAEFEGSAAAQSDEALAAFVRAQATTLYHPTSTCSMGTHAMAVVDPTCHVHGTEGLYVADASIFPSMVSGNTNAPTIMVAERAADFILHGARTPGRRKENSGLARRLGDLGAPA
ncbi:GMC family oxidoreductase N-terminal domain-containing protein [Variovorax paradoxus]|nr:GMC family oxidoreductase N-terminal domain-containing protein [Variovorax paradoxus]